jgi:hypothetical protein
MSGDVWLGLAESEGVGAWFGSGSCRPPDQGRSGYGNPNRQVHSDSRDGQPRRGHRPFRERAVADGRGAWLVSTTPGRGDHRVADMVARVVQTTQVDVHDTTERLGASAGLMEVMPALLTSTSKRPV